MEKGGPSPISPRHPNLTSPLACPEAVFTVRPAAAHPRLRRQGCRTPSALGSRTVTPPLRGDGPSLSPAGSRSASTGVAPLSVGNPTGFCPSRGLEASPRIGGGPPAPPYRLTASDLGEIGRSRRSSRPIGHVDWPASWYIFLSYFFL
ncbi:hypothetical protein NDU88_004440 [Pleurodeles waltl]|uniref:Uncharacterized protein n=1 Tax=Pleurodeles waltl TaxID=8319 RepID=A0AAV7VKT9_PLEWA|nr:hypothetical protein NDU88_004440 [Pleurodeles waltl]